MSSKTEVGSVGGGGGVGTRMATGTYNGDGNATQAIIGVGFQPRVVLIYRNDQLRVTGFFAYKTDQDGLNCAYEVAGGINYNADMIISLDADGFTVGDGTPEGINEFNAFGQAYNYTCWR